jgi:hypothetical protein
LIQFAALIQAGSIRRRRTRYAIISDKVRRISERPAMADLSEEKRRLINQRPGIRPPIFQPRVLFERCDFEQALFSLPTHPWADIPTLLAHSESWPTVDRVWISAKR